MRCLLQQPELSNVHSLHEDVQRWDLDDPILCRYTPSLSLAVVACCWFGVVALLGLVVLLLRPRKWATACITFGAAMEVVGYAMRSQSSQVTGGCGAGQAWRLGSCSWRHQSGELCTDACFAALAMSPEQAAPA